MDHVSTFTDRPACAVQGLYRKGFERTSRGGAIDALAGNRVSLGPGDPAARQCSAWPQGRPRGRGKLAPHQAFLEELVAQDPDITLYELRDALAMGEGVNVHHSSIAALLKRLSFTYKKNRWWPPSSTAPA